ncbi:hypothetical protein BDZ97DRAFT_1657979 [Flammula alnicola]|nr:hypothetical protein BDZ97DRAFT_1657979 [Flammula alnicola]
MPRNQEESPQKKRRSSRLLDRQGKFPVDTSGCHTDLLSTVAASKALSATTTQPTSASRAKRRKISDGATLLIGDRTRDSSSANVPTASGSDRRRFQRITTAELDRREKRLLLKEQDFKNRCDDLEKRILSHSRKEDETSLMMSQLAEREIQATLQQLEEHFTCALCYEILAAPYSLNPSHCGHTFCGLCILKWFFSRLHRACGGWHESVDCPICRSLLIITPELTPRLQLTFPFVPNRVTGSVVESLVEKLVNPPLCSQAKIKEKRVKARGDHNRKRIAAEDVFERGRHRKQRRRKRSRRVRTCLLGERADTCERSGSKRIGKCILSIYSKKHVYS